MKSSAVDAGCGMEGDEDDGLPHPQMVALSQTCWEYTTLLQSQDKQSKQRHHRNCNDVISDDVVDSSTSKTAPKPPDIADEGIDNISEHSGDHEANVSNGRSKRLKMAAAIAPSISNVRQHDRGVTGSSTERCPSTTTLQALRLAGAAQRKDAKHATWDAFILVLQVSGLQKITSRAGFDVDLCTLLVADPTLSFFRVTLWRRAATRGAQLINAGDLVRLNR